MAWMHDIFPYAKIYRLNIHYCWLVTTGAISWLQTLEKEKATFLN
ncbi:hypothetical protein [Xanthocytophaga agilis]|uniref:Uncharacterized protein n=1 Tax=Xanthocytophaga agilis TaxID=3048010 RepID=A0AAE3RC93_9BACT|nr:hypothetical protein [Xanthocytophaga agilis]MDJ1505767.1 hypothetical protein [Xanthocytophaga agilis]